MSSSAHPTKRVFCPQAQLLAPVEISTTFSTASEEMDCTMILGPAELLRLVVDIHCDGPPDGEDESKDGSVASSPRPAPLGPTSSLWTKLFVPLCLMAAKLTRRPDVAHLDREASTSSTAPQPFTVSVFDEMSDKDVGVLGMKM